VLAPTRFETSLVSSTANIFRVKLTDELVSSLKISKYTNFELSHLHAVVKVQEDGDILLEPNPATDNHEPLFVGEVRLFEFRALLQNEGFQTEFTNGALVCNDEVSITKTHTGKLVVEGPFTENFFKIKQLLYQQYAIL